MYELNLKSWERLPENFEALKYGIMSVSYPLMPEEPETGVTYRVYPEGCTSGNGTAYHGGVRIGNAPDKLIVYLNGGGLAYSAYTAARPQNLFYVPGDGNEHYYINDAEWMGDYFLMDGLNAAREDNPFADWSMIHLTYTTGDFHCGSGELPYTALDGTADVLVQHGYHNAMTMIRTAGKWIKEPKELLIMGSSGGGFGAAVLADDIIRQFPSAEKITCVIDSSLLLADWPAIARDVWKSPAHLQARMASDNFTVDHLAALYRKYGNRVNYLFISSIRDALLSEAQSGLDGTHMAVNRESGAKYARDLKKMCAQLTEAVPGIGLYLFESPVGDPRYDQYDLTAHCVLDKNLMFDLKTDGQTAAEWILDAMKGTITNRGISLLDAV